MTSAMASRVMSSWVGPRPPHTMTPSLRARAVREARPRCGRGCRRPGLVEVRVDAGGASCSPIHDELVSTIWPSSSSVPTATISHRMSPPHAAAHGRRGGRVTLERASSSGSAATVVARRSVRYWPPVTTVSTTATQSRLVAATWRRRRSGAAGRSRRPGPARGLELGQPGAGMATPRRPSTSRYRLDAELAGGDDRRPAATRTGPAPPGRPSPRAPAPCRPAGRGRRRSGWCPGAGPCSRRARR